MKVETEKEGLPVLFNFGKYKNTPIEECEDYIYLCRCVQHNWGDCMRNEQQRTEINKRITYGIKNKKF